MSLPMRYCVSLTEQNLHLLETIASHSSAGFEIRLDCFSSEPDLASIRDRTQRPLVATYRTVAHGGTGDVETRADRGWHLRQQAVKAGFEMIDVELDEPDLAAKLTTIRSNGARSILSHHDNQVGRDLDAPLARMGEYEADIVKLIGTGGSASEILKQARRYTTWHQQGRDNLVHFYMGPEIVASRVLSMRYGAPFTFAASSRDRSVAPGQLALADFTDLYCLDAMTDRLTRYFAVIGMPIGHSASPAFHNPGLKAIDSNTLFLPLPATSRADLNMLRDLFPTLLGFAVTKPMKEVALGMADSFADDDTQQLGAINTLAYIDGQWHGANTDMLAMKHILRTDDPGGTVRVLGYGGLGKAVVRACLSLNRPVEVTNRNPDRLRDVPPGAAVLDWQARHRPGATVLVNATSAGMAPRADTCPVTVIPNTVSLVIETVYNPRDTALLAMARAAGIDTLDGTVLFERQAAIQHRFFQQALRQSMDTPL